MDNKTNNPYAPAKIWQKTHKLIRKLRAETGETFVKFIHRLAMQEKARQEILEAGQSKN